MNRKERRASRASEGGRSSRMRSQAPQPVDVKAYLMQAEAAAVAAMRAGRPDEAEEICRQVMNEVPDNVGVTMSYATLSYERGKHAQALDAIDRALRIEADNPMILTWRGMTLEQMGRLEDAGHAFDRAIDRARGAAIPFLVNARVGAVISRLRRVYRDRDELTACRRAFEQKLDELCAYYASTSSQERAQAVKELATSTPFFLAYQGENDRDLQKKFGGLLCDLMAAAIPQYASPRPMPKLAPGEKIRIGFASAYVNRHSVWKIPLSGWLRELDKSKFETFVYNISARGDAQTDVARLLCTRLENGPMSVDRWADRIVSDNLHVLVFPEIGMDLNTYRLAALHLAPVQCFGLGHPETTGLRTMDYILSSDLMELPNGQDHYTEKVVRLPNLSVHYEPLRDRVPANRDRKSFGLRDGAVLYWSCQLPSKYLPEYDELYARIAEKVPDSQFVFIDLTRSPEGSKAFRDRWKRAFEARGLSFESRCVILPMMEPEEFAAAAKLMDVFVDSIGWSGFNSTLESLEYDMPVVTFPRESMRSRHSAAVLTRMGVTETIAKSADDFVEIAVHLGLDADHRKKLSEKIASTKDRCYRDRECITGLEAFFEQCARGERP
jgi:predicted O-linked N-acetylglucosamine transferase (SPINDLY family)